MITRSAAPGSVDSCGLAKAKPGRARPGDTRLKGALGTPAMGAIRSKDGYLQAQFRRIAAGG